MVVLRNYYFPKLDKFDSFVRFFDRDSYFELNY
jgi:hypothetical protein